MRCIIAAYCCFGLQTGKIFLLHSPMHLSSLSLISHKNKQEPRREQIGTKKDLFEGFVEFKSIRLIFLEDRKFSRSFNERASHTNKRDKPSKSNNNNKVLAQYNHPSSVEMIEQRSLYQTNHCGARIKVQDNSSDANPLMSVNNVYNCVARPCPKNTILITA